MKTEALKQINASLDAIEAQATNLYYNDEGIAIATGLIRTAVHDARKALYTSTVGEWTDDELFPLLPEQVEAEKTDGRVF